MRQRSQMILASSLALLGGLALFVGWAWPPKPLDLKLVRVEDYGDSTRRLVLQLTNSHSGPLQIREHPKIQVKMSGRWMPPEESSVDVPDSLIMRQEYWPAARVPGQAEAFRLLLSYRHQSPQDELVDLLNKYDLWRISPSLWPWLIEHLPKHRWWRHTVFELDLQPSRAHNNSVERTGASRLAHLQLVRQWRLPPAAHADR